MKALSVNDVLERYEPVTESGCWIWTGELNSKGYGRARARDIKSQGAHRLFYEAYKGPIPNGLTIDHLCRVRCCVNPDHLEVVTQRVNNLRGNTIPARNAMVTHCPQGHVYSTENTLVRHRKNTITRECLACCREYARQYRQKGRGK